VALGVEWSPNPKTSCIGSYLSASLLFDPVIYQVRVLWFDHLKPGIPDSMRGVWSHKCIPFVAIGAYIQSIALFPGIYQRMDQLAQVSHSELTGRSISTATSLSLAKPFTYVDLAQLASSLFQLVIVIATTGSIAYGREEFARQMQKEVNQSKK
jgi:hypothetical protein